MVLGYKPNEEILDQVENSKKLSYIEMNDLDQPSRVNRRI